MLRSGRSPMRFSRSTGRRLPGYSIRSPKSSKSPSAERSYEQPREKGKGALLAFPFSRFRRSLPHKMSAKEGDTMIITIDGPGGAGKSSAARALAKRLGFEFLDTGAMYRAVALAALRAGINRRDQDALSRLIAEIRLDLPPGRVLLNGEDVTKAIRTGDVTAASG